MLPYEVVSVESAGFSPSRSAFQVRLILIAFVWAYKFGIFLDSLRPIKIK
jgi:hypothetical protein